MQSVPWYYVILKIKEEAVIYFPPCDAVNKYAGLPFKNNICGRSNRPYFFKLGGAGGC
jgi:hypothetical protein